MSERRISRQLKRGAFLAAAILGAQIYAFRELVFLELLFSIAFWLMAGVVCVGVLIFEGVRATVGSHTAFDRVRLKPLIASAQTVRIAGGKRVV